MIGKLTYFWKNVRLSFPSPRSRARFSSSSFCRYELVSGEGPACREMENNEKYLFLSQFKKIIVHSQLRGLLHIYSHIKKQYTQGSEKAITHTCVFLAVAVVLNWPENVCENCGLVDEQ